MDRRWFGREVLRIVLEASVLAGLAWIGGRAWLPALALPVPAWALVFPVGLTAAAIMAWMRDRRNAQRALAAERASAQKIRDELATLRAAAPPSPPQRQRMAMFGVEWELTEMFPTHKNTERVNSGHLEICINGPYCRCGRLLQQSMNSRMDTGIACILAHCPSCNAEVPGLGRAPIDVNTAKLEVFREAQRMARQERRF